MRLRGEGPCHAQPSHPLPLPATTAAGNKSKAGALSCFPYEQVVEFTMVCVPPYKPLLVPEGAGHHSEDLHINVSLVPALPSSSVLAVD
jgi:hypothetical protein